MKLIFLILISAFISCNHFDKLSKQTLKENRKYGKDPVLACGRLSYYTRAIYFHKNDHFSQLEGPQKNKGQNQKFYAGTYYLKMDTIHMNYYKNIKPDSMATYLLKDFSGKFLIYPYKNGTDTLRLAIRKGQL